MRGIFRLLQMRIERVQRLAERWSRLLWLFFTTLGTVIALYLFGVLFIPAATSAEPLLVGDYLLIKKYPDQQTIQPGENAKFTIIVSNIDPDADLTDVVVQDLTAPDCSREIGDLPANSNFPTYNCFLPDVQEPVKSWAVVKGVNLANGQSDQARDSAIVDIIDASISIEATPSSIASPGASVDFSLDILNTGSVTVVLQSLASPQMGDLVDPGNRLLSDNECSQVLHSLSSIPSGSGITCSFSSEITGEEGNYLIEVAATAEDEAGNTITRSASKTIAIKPPVRHSTYLPVSFAKVDESNDTCPDAFPLQVSILYRFFAEDKDDWYYFDLHQSEEIVVELSNFFPRLGQIVVYTGDDCGSLRILKNNGNDLEAKPVPLGIQPPGRYFILVVNAGKPNSQVPYELIVHSR